MVTLLRPDRRDALDQLAEVLLELDPADVAAYAATLPPGDLALLETAVARAADMGWRSDPAEMAHHLTGGKMRRWRYTKLLAESFRDAVEGVHPRQIWMLPARYGKTDIASKWGPVWALDRYPHLKIILTSYGDDLANANAGAVRDMLKAYRHQLRAQVRRDASARDRWMTQEGGQVLAAGVGSAMTGFGGDVVVVDDPFKNWEEAKSKARRETVWNWYRSVVRLRLEHDDAAVIVVGTRWHEDDLAGKILAEDGSEDQWHVVRLPAIAEPDAPDAPRWWERGPDPLGREVGAVLEPERFSLPAVQSRAKDLGSHLAAALEQQRPSAPEGTTLKRGWWKFYSALPDPFSIEDWLISWDMAFKDAETSSYVVGQVWAKVGARRFLVDQVRDRMNFPTSKKAVVALAAKYPHIQRHLVEDKANGPAIIAELQGVVPGIVARTPKGSKEARAQAHSAIVEGGQCLLPDPGIDFPGLGGRPQFVNDFLEEASAFPNGSNDDQVDAWSQAMDEWHAPVQITTEQRNTARVLRGRR